VTVGPAGDTPENPAGDTTFEIDAIAEKKVAAEQHTATHRMHSLRIKGSELFG